MDDGGQISLEMLVLLAAVLAVSFLLVSQLVSTSQDYKKPITQTASSIHKTIRRLR